MSFTSISKLVSLGFLLFSLVTFGKAQQLDEIFDDRDSSYYQIVKIGNAWWMAENLAYLPEVHPLFTAKGFYVYDYYGYNVDSAKASEEYIKYGCLYSWENAMKACPQGWHLSNDLEWQDMERHLGMADFELDSLNWRKSGGVDKKLMSTDGWGDNNGNNQSGFSALPGGLSFSKPNLKDTIFGLIGESANFWTSTKEKDSSAFARGFYVKSSGVGRGPMDTYNGFSVRCIKNKLK